MAQIKTKQEIKKIKKACKITCKLFKKTLKELKKSNFKTEKDICDFLLSKTQELNLKPAFKPIIASATNARSPHHQATNKKLKKGFLIVDYGVKYQGYCSDMTRTFYMGKVSKKEIELYNRVLSVQKECIKMALPEKKCKALHNFAAKKLKYLTHGLGHGLGKKIHELPKINSKSKNILKKNMVITIEPGYYKNTGIRIEDTLIVKSKKPLILTKFPKKLKIIHKIFK
jgi:Xaa-Pro aminopeptidase